jgi:tetratricopeptide (TPR) repeat protein
VSDTAGEKGRVKRIRQRRTVTIRRDDHLGDPIGIIFLDPESADHDSLVGRLRDYLGARVRVLKIELDSARADVEVEVRSLEDEANQLAATANDLAGRGARRNALALFKQAMELDPLNPEVALGLGRLFKDLEDYPEALAMLKRARETGAASVRVLHALAMVCIKVERTASAIAYLEHALELEPTNFNVRRALMELGRKPPRREGKGSDSTRKKGD